MYKTINLMNILYIYLAGERPHMRDLNRFLTKYCGVWKAVGINLGLHQSLLNMVEADNLTKQRDCLRVTLERWLDQDIYACWHQLEIAITKALKVTSTEAPTPQPSTLAQYLQYLDAVIYICS